jgi:hypothetical protein
MVSRNKALRLGRDGIHSTDKTFTILHIRDRSPRISDPCSAALQGSCDGRTICSRKYFDWRQSRASWRRFADSFMLAYSHIARRCRAIPDTSAACSALCACVIRAADGCRIKLVAPTSQAAALFHGAPVEIAPAVNSLLRGDMMEQGGDIRRQWSRRACRTQGRPRACS